MAAHTGFVSHVVNFNMALLALIGFLFLALAYVFGTIVYNVYFHPLCNYPGPKLWAATRIPLARSALSGQLHRKILQLHQEYGPVVRVAPDELVFNHPDSFKDIHGHVKNNTGDHGRDPVFIRGMEHGIIGANREDHTRFRRALSHGFAAQTMLEQQPIIIAYIDLMIQRLHENCAGGSNALDMVSWYNWTTFDVIGDLAFGESFHCLEDADYHPWVQLIFDSVKAGSVAITMRRFPWAAKILMKFVPAELIRKRAQHFAMTEQKVKKRLAAKTERPDFMDSMLRKRGSEALTFDELKVNSSTLITAGSETTATALSAMTYYLLTNPNALKKASDEIRNTFTSEADIDMISSQKLVYMHAVINEALRMYPPAPSGIPRRVKSDGGVFLGQYVPPDTIVHVWHWAMYHSPANFALPDSFIPERWLDDPRFAGDKKEALQPFTVGPRSCIGRNLAYGEMRLILARVLFNFDLRLADESRGWDEQSQVYTLWEKGPLKVFLTPRKTA
ncbi:cytochrome P450 [Colletotrichum graminicola M1.001]|uniref:Cytochrome P450 n=1 Tax=Colletotrichum graminicola (strain M1.001 / M2 / FGSC 10212) TaxID=645133 RepID=E3QKG3_COLGM|nr:cytochrome P450 [Colletotrichum graminicola M1.001]EFQ31351.1 cytochrome P450 [Colletotrichum graminicola M1.001]